MNMLGLSWSVGIAHIACYWRLFFLHNIQVLCRYRLCKADHAYLMAVSMTTAKFKPLTFYMSGFAFSYTTNMFILIILYDFCLLPAQFCYNRILTEGCKPCANRRPVCILEYFQWCGKPYFVGAAILRGRCLPLITRRASVIHYWSDQCWRLSLMLPLSRSLLNKE
jgi:hypothetical protein